MSAQDVGDQDVEETARRFKDPATYNGEPVCVCCGDGWPNCVDRRPDGSRYSHLDTCYRYKWADLCDRCERECAEETQAPGVDLGREGLTMSLPNTDGLANAIRTVDGGHTLGAGALAEALQSWLAEHDRQIRQQVADEIHDQWVISNGHYQSDEFDEGMRVAEHVARGGDDDD